MVFTDVCTVIIENENRGEQGADGRFKGPWLTKLGWTTRAANGPGLSLIVPFTIAVWTLGSGNNGLAELARLSC